MITTFLKANQPHAAINKECQMTAPDTLFPIHFFRIIRNYFSADIPVDVGQ